MRLIKVGAGSLPLNNSLILVSGTQSQSAKPVLVVLRVAITECEKSSSKSKVDSPQRQLLLAEGGLR